jgi:putative ABC transport system permease protein
MSSFRFILDELRFFQARSVLIILSVAFAFMAYGMLATLRFSLQSGESSVAEGRLIVTHRDGLMQTLPLALRDQIKGLSGVGNVGHATWTGSFYQEPDELMMALAVEPEIWLDQHPDMIVTPEVRRRFLATRDGMLVSEALARQYNWKVGARIPFGSILYAPPAGEKSWSYLFVGTFRTDDSGGGRNYIVSHFDYLNENRTVWRDTVGSYMVTPRANVSAKSLAERIDGSFAAAPSPTSSATDRAFHDQFFQQFGDMVTIITAIISITFVSVVLVVSSGMALAIRQSARDFGLLRVIGYSNMRILALILTQALILIGIGAAIGLGVAAITNWLLARYLPEFMPDIVIPWQVVGEASLIALLIAAIVSSVPSWLALRISPIAAFARGD